MAVARALHHRATESFGEFGGDLTKPVQQCTPTWQFEQDLKTRKRDDWLQTDNAKADIIGGISAVGRQTGYA